MKDLSVKRAVVALEECGYQCQYIEGTVIATRDADTHYFVEDKDGNAVGVFPADVSAKMNTLTESAVNKRFSRMSLTEMGYGEFEPSSDSPTGTEPVSKDRFKVKSGEQSVTSDDPKKPKGMKGIDSPVDDTDLPKDYTGGSKNNSPLDLPATGKGASDTVGANGGTGGGKGAGPVSKNPEKTQAMKVGNSVYQKDSPESNKSKNYTGTKVGEIGTKAVGKSDISSQGTMPAPLPKEQGAQSLAKIPSVKTGKMAVTDSKISSVLSMFEEKNAEELLSSSMDEAEQKAQQFSGQNLVLLTKNKGGSWSVGSSFDKGWSPSDYMNIKDAATDHSTTGGGTSKIIATNEDIEAIRRRISTNPAGDVSSLGQEVFVTESIAGAMDTVGKVAADVATGVGKVGKRLAKPVLKGAGAATKAVGAAASAAGDALSSNDESIAEAVRTFPKYLGILEELHPGPYISRNTFKQIDLADIERKLTPHLVEAIASYIQEQEDMDVPPPPDDENAMEEDPILDAEGDEDDDAMGMDAPDVGMESGEEGAEEEPLDDAGVGGTPDIGMGGGGLPDIGADPAPQPVGGEIEDAGIPAPEPELPPDDRWAKAREACPDCDDATLSELVQYDIVNDLQKAMFDKFVSHLNKQRENASKIPLAASKNSNIGTSTANKNLHESKAKKNPYIELKRFEEGFLQQPRETVSIIVEALMRDSSLLERAASLVLGIEEGNNYQRREVESAANQLRALGDQVYEVREQLGNVITSSVGDILRRVSSPLVKGAFAAEAQQIHTQLSGIQGRLDQFIKQIPHWEDAFQNAYSNLGISVDSSADMQDETGMSGDAGMPEEPSDMAMGGDPEMGEPMSPSPDAGMDIPTPPSAPVSGQPSGMPAEPQM